MNKIGILTFHRARNYGAFLQAFALKAFLQDSGFDVEIVDYWPDAHAELYKLFSIKRCASLLYHPRSLCKYLYNSITTIRQAKARKRKMDYLLESYLQVKKQVRFKRLDDNCRFDFDVIVYGSDQIWWKSNIKGYEGMDPVYWGAYIQSTIKKVAYAPSMGIMDIDDIDKRFIECHLKNFDSLSVREHKLQLLLQPFTEKQIYQVLDPVFLVSQKTWVSFTNSIYEEKYILYYNIIKSDNADKFVQKLQTKYNLNVIEITGSVSPRKSNGKYKYLQTLDALEFISYIKDAEYVVCTSFHGIAFSIIFEKNLYALGMKRNSERVRSLLEICGISERLNENPETLLKLGNIDFVSVKEKLECKIKESKKFLIGTLSGLL